VALGNDLDVTIAVKNRCGSHLLRCGGAHFLAYRLDMSRSLRAVRLAAGHLTTFFNKRLTRSGV